MTMNVGFRSAQYPKLSFGRCGADRERKEYNDWLDGRRREMPKFLRSDEPSESQKRRDILNWQDGRREMPDWLEKN